MIQQTSVPNLYVFSGDQTTITYSLSEDATLALDYQDAKGTLSFVDTEVRRQDSELGTLISVSLKRTVDAGATILTLILPPINMAGQTEQDFETFAIITQSYGILPRQGARLTYQALMLEGAARQG